MSQGSFLGPLTLVILMVDGMTAGDLTHRYIDDATATELIRRQATSHIQSIVNNLVSEASQCHVNINRKKTKEIWGCTCTPGNLCTPGSPMDWRWTSDNISAPQSWHIWWFQVDATRRCVGIKSCFKDVLSEATEEEVRHIYWGLDFLHHNWTIWSVGITAETSTGCHFQCYRLLLCLSFCVEWSLYTVA